VLSQGNRAMPQLFFSAYQLTTVEATAAAAAALAGHCSGVARIWCKAGHETNRK